MYQFGEHLVVRRKLKPANSEVNSSPSVLSGTKDLNKTKDPDFICTINFYGSQTW